MRRWTLWNRRAMEERLRQEWARIQRYGGAFAVIMADMDHFKLVNDTYGHPAGDQVLRDVATLLVGECRDTDLPARYGGEEFTIVLPTHRATEAAVLADGRTVSPKDRGDAGTRLRGGDPSDSEFWRRR
ncbi:MAG: GGDEF domain-containing protein [Planctomycetota bacterium]|nr:GGDEF domain-containing protein [Planctomycetota bacterium]